MDTRLEKQLAFVLEADKLKNVFRQTHLSRHGRSENDAEGLSTQKAREDAAKRRIFSLLPADQASELISLFDEFEECETAEARFAHVMDNLQPLLLNNGNDGSDWKEHRVTADKVRARQARTALGSKTLYELSFRIIDENVKKGNLKE